MNDVDQAKIDLAKILQTLKETKNDIADLERQKTDIVNAMSRYAEPKKQEADKLVTDAQVKAQGIIAAADAMKLKNDAEALRLDGLEKALSIDQLQLADGQNNLKADREAFEEHVSERTKEYADKITILDAREAALAEQLEASKKQSESLDEREAAVAALETNQKNINEEQTAEQVYLSEKEQLVLENEAHINALTITAQALADKNVSDLADIESKQKIQDVREYELNSQHLFLESRENDLAAREKVLADRAMALDAQAKINQEQADANTDSLNLISVKKRELDQKIQTLENLRSSK